MPDSPGRISRGAEGEAWNVPGGARLAEPVPDPDILVVDDDATLREGLIDFFRLEGRSAVGAPNGAEALFLLGRGSGPE